MILTKLLFGGFGRRGLEALLAALVLALSNAIVASALMVIIGSRIALSQAETADRPELIQVKARFNRALFETPRRGNLPPLTLPVYEPLIDPERLVAASSGAAVLMRQSLLRNVVSGDGFLNVYVFGIDPVLERQVSRFSLREGRFLDVGDRDAAVLDLVTAAALGVELGNRIGIRTADGTDFLVTVVGVLNDVQLRDPPPRSIEATGLRPADDFVSGGIFVSLPASKAIFRRATLTDALVDAPNIDRVDALVATLRETFRLEPGIFVIERAGRFGRKVRDFTLSLGFFSALSTAAAGLAGALAVFLLRDVYADRRQQHAILAALGFSPGRNTLMLMGVGFAVAVIGAVSGALLAVVCTPARFGMPSLMADLGSVEPRFDLLIGMIVTALSLAACGLGLTQVVRRLLRNPVAAELAETEA